MKSRVRNINMPAKHNPRLVIIGQEQIRLQDSTVSYTIKQSYRIRAIRLEIRQETGLTVIVPRKYKPEQVEDILVQKSRWILRHLHGGKPLQMPLFKPAPGHGDSLPYLGKTIKIAVTAEAGKHPAARLIDGRLLIPLNSGANTTPILEKWFREQAKLVFRQKADTFKVIMGLSYNALLIRGQRTRWGSCSPTGNITLNWKLLMAPQEIVDYVIIHELAHRKYMNHSRKFWQFVERFCPRWKECRKWLVKHEYELKSSAAFGI
jgi:predicted metal-dependent hydrolase